MKETLMNPALVLENLAAARARPFDITQPVQTRDGRRVLDLKLGSLDQRNPDRRLASFRVQGDPALTVRNKYAKSGMGLISNGVELPDDLVNLIEDTGYTRRSLRQDRDYKLRDGRDVEFLSWTGDPETPCVVQYRLTDEESRVMGGRKIMIGEYHKSGRIYPNGQDTALDLIEINQTITKWVRVYDKEPKIDADSGKQIVAEGRGANRKIVLINAAIPLGWYVFDTELEARSSLQGVRAVFKVEFKEGEGVS